MSEFNTPCKKCNKFAGSFKGLCSVCAREEGFISLPPSTVHAIPSFRANEFVRILSSDKLAIFRAYRPGNQALIDYLDTSMEICLQGRPLLSYMAAGETAPECTWDCRCTWIDQWIQISDLERIDEEQARLQIASEISPRNLRRQAFWADNTAATCPFKDCLHCGHRFCGAEDCQDGSTPSGGAWSIKCSAQERCPSERSCRWCAEVRKGPYGGTEVCCQCRLPDGPWSRE